MHDRPAGHKWWGICPACFRERPINPRGLLKVHRMWYDNAMIQCPGSGYKPAEENKNGNYYTAWRNQDPREA